MTKAEVVSASGMLSALAGKTVPFEVEGVTVELRSLEWAEGQELNEKYSNNVSELTFQLVVRGLVNPKLSAEEVEQLRKVKPGAIAAMSQRIAELSGMSQQAGGSPLAGSGSPNPPKK